MKISLCFEQNLPRYDFTKYYKFDSLANPNNGKTQLCILQKNTRKIEIKVIGCSKNSFRENLFLKKKYQYPCFQTFYEKTAFRKLKYFIIIYSREDNGAFKIILHINILYLKFILFVCI